MAHLPQMRFDVLGRLRNTKVALKHAFIPMFEAVVNSIHSTEDRFGTDVSKFGEITVNIRRVPQEHLPSIPGPRPIEPIRSIEVSDNGCGFNDANLAAFETADTTAKAARGGKGVGRFTWLVVFHRARIDSTYDGDDERRRRSFEFRRSRAGVEDFAEQPAAGAELQTRIVLDEVESRYMEHLRRGPDVIADRLFEHCFNYFVLGRCPQIRLQDDAADGDIDVNGRLENIVIENPEELRISDHSLYVRHVQLRPRAGLRHEAHLCADERVVTTFSLSQVSDLEADPVPGLADESPWMHHVFVTGDALDDAVDSTRTRLELPDGEPLSEQGGALDLRTLREEIGQYVNARLASILEERRLDNFRQVRSHIQAKQPEYRILLRHVPTELERVKWTDDEQQMDLELYRVLQGWEASVRRQQSDVEQRLTSGMTELNQLIDDLHKVIVETNEAGQANLVRYVVKRRAVLNLLGQFISRNKGVALEEQVHRLVFPLKKTGDDVDLDDHNLWLVDDSLAFYEYLSSDLPFKSNDASPTDSSRRPDILAFKTGDPYQHVVLVEFKRPDRDDDNPVDQLVEYAQLLRKGGRLDIHNRQLPGIPRTVRIEAFAIMTLSPKTDDMLERSAGDLRKVENEDRWYGYHTMLNMSIEVLGYRAFIRRAEQRNHSFFVKLGLR